MHGNKLRLFFGQGIPHTYTINTVQRTNHIPNAEDYAMFNNLNLHDSYDKFYTQNI